jgi:exopolysaccharide biosynthesis polyprenyl glycosylphosphotransferase
VKKRNLVILYVLLDFIAASLSWTCFYIYRKTYIESEVFGYEIPLELGSRFFIGILTIPAAWLFLYYVTGSYHDVYHKSRLKELGQTLLVVISGVVIIFFVLILDDVIVSYKDYYSSFLVLASLQFVLTYTPRLILTSAISRWFRKKKIGFRALMVGSNERAMELFQEIQLNGHSAGTQIIGYVNGNSKKEHLIDGMVRHLGPTSKVSQVVKEHQIEEVIIALDTTERHAINKIVNNLSNSSVVIKAIPDIHDILVGQVRVEGIYGTPLIHITHELMPEWQKNLKRILDVSFSVIALLISLPVILFLVAGVKLSSRGPVLLRQERIGRHGKAFTLFKFRSMYLGAEKNGPELSRKDDERLTSFGKFMRKWKLDEIPNFWNVLKGEMSLVGPRPERRYYIDQIVKRVPHYVRLHRIKPGITSWGQVKYGYAENIDEMIMRLKYDLLYMENMSLFVDFQIMISTIITLFKGRHV